MKKFVIFMVNCLMCLTLSVFASAEFKVTDLQGQPLEDAVIELIHPDGHTLPSGMAEVAQQDLTFRPFVLAVPKGTAVEFPNQDKTRHHVYSFSPAKVFELKLYAGKPEAPVVFDTPGIVALGCNIHDYMQAFVYVGVSPLLMVTDMQGLARFEKLPAAEYQLNVWHPWQNADIAPMKVKLPMDQPLVVPIDVTRQQKPSRPKKGFGQQY